MANELDAPSFGNFSIEDTMEMGMGNPSLLKDLLSPETVTSSTDDIQKIESEDVKKKAEKVKADALKSKKEEVEKKEEEKTDPLADFLSEEEEVEDKDKKIVKKPKEEKKEENIEEEAPEDNRFTALSKDLLNLGVFSKDEGEEDVEITTSEEFLERFNFEKKKGAIEVVDKFIGQFGEEYQDAFQAIYVKGVNPREYFNTYNNIKDFSSLDLKEEINQIAVIKQALSNQGFEAEDITTEVERIKNYGDLESVAAKHHKVLVKNEAAKLAQLEKESEAKLQQYASIRNQYIKNVQTILNDKVKNKEFDGIPINPKLATELQDFLITDKYKTPSGETLTEFDKTILELKRPENHERKIKLALLLKILEKDPTLSTIQKAGITKKTDVLFSELARQKDKTSIKTEKVDKPSSWF